MSAARDIKSMASVSLPTALNHPHGRQRTPAVDTRRRREGITMPMFYSQNHTDTTFKSITRMATWSVLFRHIPELVAQSLL
jgi:hypothetical protein